MTFEQAVAGLWDDYPGWRWLVRTNDDCTAYWARIESPDYESVTWTAGDQTKTDVLAGVEASSGWCSSPAEAIEHAVVVMEHQQGLLRE